MVKQSILKKRKKNRHNSNGGESKQNVSFAATSSTKFFTKEESKEKKYQEMSVDEEDALDPTLGASQDDDNSKIRDAKSARAIKRHSGDIEGINQQDNEVAKGDSFQGEEVADERFSLLHDSSSTSKDGGDCPIEPFNLKSEREDGEGYFDGDTYVFRRGNGDEEEDAWLDNLNDNEKESLSSDNKKGFPIMKAKTKRVSTINEEITKEEAYEQLIPLLSSDEETILQALSRYGTIVKREKKQKSKNNSASSNALNRITELCNVCMMNFDDGGNIYDFTRAKLQQFLNQSDAQASRERKRKSSVFDNNVSFNDAQPTKQSKVGNSSNNQSGSTVMWEYRGNEDNKIHGPYSTQQMMEWTKAGFFVGQMAVDIRIISNGNAFSTEKAKEETVDSLLGDLEDSDNEDDGKKSDHKSDNEWLRSDSVKFETYL